MSYPSRRQRWYREKYLPSEHWTETSRRVRGERPWCEVCQDARSQNVHHLSYDRLWRERDEDLQAICRPCHERTHSRPRRRSASRARPEWWSYAIGWTVVVCIVVLLIEGAISK